MKSICVFLGSNDGADPLYGHAARDMGRELARRGITCVYGGSNTGLMRELAEGVLSAGGRVVGVTVQTLKEKEKFHSGLTRLHVVNTMQERKRLLIRLSDAFIALPGGIGTLEELFEVLSLNALELNIKPCALLNINHYWDRLTGFLNHAMDQGFMKATVKNLLIQADTPAGVLDLLCVTSKDSPCPPVSQKVSQPAGTCSCRLCNLEDTTEASTAHSTPPFFMNGRPEEEIRKLLRAVEESPSSVVITDAFGAIEYVNTKFCEVTGYTVSEVLGQNPRVLNSDIQSKAFYREMWETLSQGQEWRGEFCNKKKDGTLYWEHASISPLCDARGNITHYVAVKEDVTETKRILQELEKAREAAEVSNIAKSDFLTSMSHELRTPLNAIIGFSEVLQDRFFGPLTDKQSEYLDDILGAGQHLLSLINDILDLSKVEAGKMMLEIKSVKVSDAIETGLVMLKEKIACHGITVKTDFKETCHKLTLAADERKLKQIIFNILSNAVKFTPDGGTITIEMMVLDPDPIPGTDILPDWMQKATGQVGKQPHLIISIADTGIGISSEDLPHIFEEFYQTLAGIRASTPGTGLGLPLSKRMAELHGGTIMAHSEGPDKGSRFTLLMPLMTVSGKTPVALSLCGAQEQWERLSPDNGLLIHLQRTHSLSSRHNRSYSICRAWPRQDIHHPDFHDLRRALQKTIRSHDFAEFNLKDSIVFVLQETDTSGGTRFCERITRIMNTFSTQQSLPLRVAGFADKDTATLDDLLEQVLLLQESPEVIPEP
ncbi:multidomain fusion protein (N:DNA-binding domain/C:signal transduction histidine kinase) [Desulforapulum autotrophicum HRM2]|uniref:AMP nucleosidase n=1 Tax=Desulforapulum autotrophicum (strain ATCC 43914 / DSM 3382 / VKM B-1955 / HRM2) TaxID=177437 RepID=C0QMA0_DESAH|nr:TIGR00730 family Rossman fold protein [Desulforapulum autotrophicum]ACN16417.1 multidomain fusion protein (N:DNA-binding domain/C:signal transduction histidine kinase) [Desulforapulum autotrophicum HRM2]